MKEHPRPPVATCADWEGPERFYHLLLRLFDRIVDAWIDLRVVEADRIPRVGPVLLVANHVSFVDPIVLGILGYRRGRKIRFLALSDLFSRPVVGWVLHLGRMIPVFRGGGTDRMADAACAALNAGQAVLVYPEGHITKGKRLPGQPGAGLLALRTSTPVVPLCSYGLVTPKGRHVPRPRQRAAVVVGPPVDLASLRGRTDRQAQLAASETMLDAIYELLPHAGQAAGRDH